ncbi:hypothetical protein Fot_11448 [Forsythia ovata]|uniref:Uncharacterized protein n=1 Tax=Forsythia ovata TaxID=205694 RepID=A0ABD1WMK9_9LAMI
MTDNDLQVLPGLPSSLLQFFHNLGFNDVNRIVEISVDVGLEEVSKLLKRSLLSKSPLTDVFVRKQDHFTNTSLYESTHSSFPKIVSNTVSINSTLSIKLLFTVSGKKVLAVEANESFVDILFSFCAIPLIKLLGGDSGLGCIDILYKTVESMDPEFLYLENKDITNVGVHEQYKCKPQLLQIRSPENRSSKCFGKFLKDTQLFVVLDNLTVTPSSSVSCISFVKALYVPIEDIEVRVVTISEHERMA